MKRAFTLVECLIVIGVLGALSGILFSVMAPAREKAREVACIGNLKNIYEGAALYAVDNAVPPLPGGFENIMAFPSVDALLNYTGSHEVFFCPNTTVGMRKKWGSTYGIVTLFADGAFDSQAYKSQILRDLAEFGAASRFATCTIHNETYYAPPADADLSSAAKGVFEIRMRIDGSAKTGYFKEQVPIFQP